MSGSITDVHGVKVGHWSDRQARTGCTAILLPETATGSVHVSGSAPATRETPVMSPASWVREVNAICLAGGSAYGLDAAGGVMRHLEQMGIGHVTKFGLVPIVGAACIYDLNQGDASVRPGIEQGRAACIDAGETFETGAVGAGTGATCGKWQGIDKASPAGIGTAAMTMGDVVVGCLCVVSPIGDIIDARGEVIRGVGGPLGQAPDPTASPNTILTVVATNGRLTRSMCHRAATRIPDGIARAVRPAHTLHDGDTGFFVSCGNEQASADVVFQLTTEVVTEAIRSVAL